MTLAQIDILLGVHNAAIRRQRATVTQTQEAGRAVSMGQWASMVADHV